MNIPFTSLVTGPHYFTEANVTYLKKMSEELQGPAKEKSRDDERNYYPNICDNYQNRMSRLIHYFACQCFVKQVEESSYTIDSLKDYFNYKIQLQKDLYRCELLPNEHGQLAMICNLKPYLNAPTDSASCLLKNSESLTKKIIQYVNQQEAEYFSLLPRSDQYKIFYAVYRDKISAFTRSPEGVLSAVLGMALGVLFSMAWFVSHNRDLNPGCGL